MSNFKSENWKVVKVPDKNTADKFFEIVSESGQASISMLQRRLRVGYNRAARMIETMEQDELGMGCAQDQDVVAQYAMLGELVFG